MTEGRQPFAFDPQRQLGIYTCPRCRSSKVHVISYDVLFCEDCRNETTLSERKEWFLKQMKRLADSQMDLEEGILFLRQASELNATEIEELKCRLFST
jgi:hypothetical protein